MGKSKERNVDKKRSRAIRWQDAQVSVKAKLSVLWIGVMFLYIYADILGFYETGYMEQVIAGTVEGFVFNQATLLSSAILMSISPVMAFLSLILKPAVNRIVNIALGSLHILLAIAMLFGPGETWAYFYWFSALEVGFHTLIVLHALKWPRT